MIREDCRESRSQSSGGSPSGAILTSFGSNLTTIVFMRSALPGTGDSAVSRTRRKVANDADRLRKYLARFDLQWSDSER